MGIPLPALGIKPPEQQDPVAQYGRLVSLKNMLQMAPLQQQALRQQVQEGQIELQNKQALGEAFQQAYQQPQGGQLQPGTLQPGGTPGMPNTGSIVNYLATHGAGSAIPGAVQGLQAMQATLDKHTEAVDKHIESQNDIVGSTGASLKQAVESNDDASVQRIIADTARAYPDSAAKIQQAYSQGGLQALAPLSKQMLAQSPKWQQLDNERIAAQARQLSAENNIDYWIRKTQDPDPAVRASAQAIVDAQATYQATIARKTAEQKLAVETSPAALAGAAAKAGAETGARVAAETNPAALAGRAAVAGAEANARIPAAVATEVQKAQALAPALQDVTKQTVAGRQYVDLTGQTGPSAELLRKQALASGVPVADKDQADSLNEIDTARKNQEYMLGVIGGKLASGPAARLYQAPANTIEKLAQTDPDLAAIGTFRNAAIQSMRAVAGSKGIRINQALIQTSIDNDIPKLTDTLPVAQAKLRNLKAFLDNSESSVLKPSASRQAQPGGTVQVVDPRGKAHTFPDRASADAFKQAAGIK